jgi:hypothetical protein
MRALSVFLLSLAVLPTHADDQSVTWRGDYRAALREAKETGKPLLVEFRCEA